MKKEENNLLDHIAGPKDLENITNFDKLCDEIREKIIFSVSKNGGHLSSNLGVVELTVALHRVFSGEEDRIIWDVGHQCYTHKILTGRADKIEDIRTSEGVSGFPNKDESSYDLFTSGHSSTAISSALGVAYSNKINKKNCYTIAVLGDGALTGGLAYEGLNNAGKFNGNFIVILNDNKMSISRNVGAISRYLTIIRMKPSYTKIKYKTEYVLNKIPLFGKKLVKFIRKLKTAFKGFLYSTNIFEDMGFLYYGTVDGHDIKNMIKVFEMIKKLNHPVLVHIVTKKGKGYKFAEDDPKHFHGIAKFDAKTGSGEISGESFSKVFGDELCKIAEKNSKICAITAAMKSGTGLNDFAKNYKNRFFDVGIAEEHAVTFAGGLATGGMIPVVAIYSTFLQRAYDQIMHDVALQNVKVVFGVDRAGLIGEDGETHQGLFDVPFLNSVPKIKIFAPSFFDELKTMLNTAIYGEDKLSAIRYPKGGELYKPSYFKCSNNNFDLFGDNKSGILLVTYGRIFSHACLARERLMKEYGVDICVLKMNVIKPIDRGVILECLNYEDVFMFEESSKSGSIGESLAERLLESNFKGKYTQICVNDVFVKYDSTGEQMKKFYLDFEGMVEKILFGIGKIK